MMLPKMLPLQIGVASVLVICSCPVPHEVCKEDEIEESC